MLDFRWIDDPRNGRVFGTWYLPEDVLSERCPNDLHLKDVSIWHERCQTGLDVTHNHLERPLLPTDFFGVLTVQKSYWLKREAKAILSVLIEERHQQKTIGFEDPTNLDKLYDEDETIDIRLKCSMSNKVMQPQCYSLDKLPESLLFHSLDTDGEGKRRWIIDSMDPYTFKHSRNYLHRYTVLALLKDIAFPLDPDNPKSLALNYKVPVEQRTPEWFVDEYIKRYNASTTYRHSRFQFMPKNRDKDLEITDSEDEDIKTTLKKTKTTRFPRHLSRAEVRAQFASCAEWILAEQSLKLPARREVNISAWDSFIKTVVRPGRRSAYPWGMPYEGMAVPEHPNADLSNDRRDVYLEDYCSVDAVKLRKKLEDVNAKSTKLLDLQAIAGPELAESRPSRPLPRRAATASQRRLAITPTVTRTENPLHGPPSPLRGPRRRRRSSSPDYIPTSPAHSEPNQRSSTGSFSAAKGPSPSPSRLSDTEDAGEVLQEPPRLLKPRYDSDFSNSDDSDAGQQSDDSDIDEIDPGLILPIPRSCFFDYTTLPGSFTWKCDVKGCSWSVNKLHLYQREEEKTHRGGAFLLLDKTEKEEYIETMFKDVIEDHQIGHFVEWGIGMRWNGDKAVFYWKRPREHKPYPHVRNRYGTKIERLPKTFKPLTLP